MIERGALVTIVVLLVFFLTMLLIRGCRENRETFKYSDCLQEVGLTIFSQGEDTAKRQEWERLVGGVVFVNCEVSIEFCGKYSLPHLPAIISADGTIIPFGNIEEVAKYTKCVGPEERLVPPGFESNFLAEIAKLPPAERKKYLVIFLPRASEELRKRIEFEFATTLQAVVRTSE